jgi:hypothetical protein
MLGVDRGRAAAMLSGFGHCLPPSATDLPASKLAILATAVIILAEVLADVFVNTGAWAPSSGARPQSIPIETDEQTEGDVT